MLFDILHDTTVQLNEHGKPMSLYAGEIFEAVKAGPRYCFQTFATVGGEEVITGTESAWLSQASFCDMIRALIRRGVIATAN